MSAHAHSVIIPFKPDIYSFPAFQLLVCSEYFGRGSGRNLSLVVGVSSWNKSLAHNSPYPNTFICHLTSMIRSLEHFTFVLYRDCAGTLPLLYFFPFSWSIMERWGTLEAGLSLAFLCASYLLLHVSFLPTPLPLLSQVTILFPFKLWHVL